MKIARALIGAAVGLSFSAPSSLHAGLPTRVKRVSRQPAEDQLITDHSRQTSIQSTTFGHMDDTQLQNTY
jgi:hypothetical protein